MAHSSHQLIQILFQNAFLRGHVIHFSDYNSQDSVCKIKRNSYRQLLPNLFTLMLVQAHLQGSKVYFL